STKTLSDGRTVKFNYEITNSICRLTSVVDPDGLTNLISYENTNFFRFITSVGNIHSRTAHLQYDSSSNLTTIVDAIGLTTSFLYDSQGLITNMITPYGTTTFQATTNSGTGVVNRSLLITEPNGSHQLYMYRVQADQLNPSNATALIP